MTTQKSTEPTPAPARHLGRCHCGAVRFAVDVDASRGTMCNCTICRRVNQVSATVKPAQFSLLSPPSSATRYPNAIGARYFCATCGVHCYGEGDLPELGGAFVSVNLNTLDDVDAADVAIEHWDGRHNNWHAGLRKTPWPQHVDGERCNTLFAAEKAVSDVDGAAA